jgi:hypothetical protein
MKRRLFSVAYLQAIENRGDADGRFFQGWAMCFVFIVEISKLLKTGEEVAEFTHFDGGQGCAQDASRAHRIGLWSRLTVPADAQGAGRLDGA